MKTVLVLLAASCLLAVGCGGTGDAGGAGGGGGGAGGGGGGAGGGGGGNSPTCSALNCAGCCLNHVCQAGNTAAGCGKAGVACSTCVTGQVCKVDQTCGVDPDSTWKVQPASATIATMNGGATWDFGGGAPDAYVTIWCPSSSATPVVTPTANDTFTPTWTSGGCTAKASELIASGFAIALDDEDVSADDGISGKGTINVTEALLLAGSVDGITNNTTLTTMKVLLQKQ